MQTLIRTIFFLWLIPSIALAWNPSSPWQMLGMIGGTTRGINMTEPLDFEASATAQDASPGTAASITHGLTIAEGDLLIAYVNGNGANTFTDNNGGYPFDEDAEGTAAPSSGGSRAIYSRVASASEPAAYAWTLANSATWRIVLLQFKPPTGYEVQSDVFDVAPSANMTTGTSTAPDVGAITILNDESLSVAIATVDSASGTFSGTPSGYSEAHKTDGANIRPTAAYYKEVDKGSENPGAWTLSASADWGAEVFSLLPAIGSALDPDPCSITENPETSCSDGVDNDCDGYIDMLDPECSEGGESITEQFWVTQTGTDVSGGTVANGQGEENPFSAADFNSTANWDTDVAVDGKIGPGDKVYFSGTFTTRLVVTMGGSASGDVILDGYQSGSCDPISQECTGSAYLNAGMEIGNETSHPGYITVQDFRMTRTAASGVNPGPGFRIYADTGGDIEHIIVRRNLVEKTNGTNFYIGRANYWVVEDNKFDSFGQNNTDATQMFNINNCNYTIVRNNQIGHDDITNPSGCESANIIETHGLNNALFEYNDLYGAPNQRSLEVKEDLAQSNIIVRYNKIHGNHSRTSGGQQAGGGIKIGAAEGGPSLSYTYIYGNYIYDNWQWGILSNADTTDHVYVWSNLVSSNGQYGLGISGYRGDPEYNWFFNNTIARNGDRDESDLSRGGIVITGGDYFYIQNNILWNNRPGGAGSRYYQVYSEKVLDTLEHNTLYHSSSTANYYYAGAIRSLATMQSTYGFENDSPAGAIEDAVFTDPNGSDNTYGTEDDDYTLQSGSPCIDDGTDLSFATPKTVDLSNSDSWFESVTGYSTITMTGAEALDPDTDWSGQPSSTKILTLDRDTVGWDRGAYAYE